jgi:hypothetical protein
MAQSPIGETPRVGKVQRKSLLEHDARRIVVNWNDPFHRVKALR